MPTKITVTTTKPFNKTWYGDLPGNSEINQQNIDLFIQKMSESDGYISHVKVDAGYNVRQYEYIFENADKFYAARAAAAADPQIKELFDIKIAYENENGFNKSFVEEEI